MNMDPPHQLQDFLHKGLLLFLLSLYSSPFLYDICKNADVVTILKGKQEKEPPFHFSFLHWTAFKFYSMSQQGKGENIFKGLKERRK